jgi:hypothetical protein
LGQRRAAVVDWRWGQRAAPPRHGSQPTHPHTAAVCPHQLNTAGSVARPTTWPRARGTASDSICAGRGGGAMSHYESLSVVYKSRRRGHWGESVGRRLRLAYTVTGPCVRSSAADCTERAHTPGARFSGGVAPPRGPPARRREFRSWLPCVWCLGEYGCACVWCAWISARVWCRCARNGVTRFRPQPRPGCNDHPLAARCRLRLTLRAPRHHAPVLGQTRDCL